MVLVATPTAIASRDDMGGGCTNYGIVVMATLLGRNDYCVGEDCSNYGTMIFVGETHSCYRDGLLVICDRGVGCISVRERGMDG